MRKELEGTGAHEPDAILRGLSARITSGWELTEQMMFLSRHQHVWVGLTKTLTKQANDILQHCRRAYS